ncbi:MAG: YkgJ family cysteine cluster protein [Crocinitomicaceae bacterium]
MIFSIGPRLMSQQFPSLRKRLFQIEMNYLKELEFYKNNKTEVDNFFKKLKKKKPKDVDTQFHELHVEIFSEIDCLQCANCCNTTSPIFRDIDIKRISRKLKTGTLDFEKEYLKIDEEGDKVLKSSPCSFLGSDNKCFIYDCRPQACKEYPHTDRKRMYQILNLTRRNMEICPAVSRIVQRMLQA